MTEIVRDEEHSGGAPAIDDTGIRVIDVAGAYEHSGYSPDEIAEFYPALTLEEVHTAIAYYYAHIDEFRDAASDASGSGRTWDEPLDGLAEGYREARLRRDMTEIRENSEFTPLDESGK